MQIATFIVEFGIIVPNSLKLTMKTSHQSNTMLRCKNSLQIRNIVFLSQYTHLSLDIEGARNPWGGSTFYPSKSWSRSFEQFCSGWSGEQIKRPKSNLIQTGAHISMPNHGFGRWLASHTGQWFELRVPNGQLCKVMRQKKKKKHGLARGSMYIHLLFPDYPKTKTLLFLHVPKLRNCSCELSQGVCPLSCFVVLPAEVGSKHETWSRHLSHALHQEWRWVRSPCAETCSQEL